MHQTVTQDTAYTPNCQAATEYAFIYVCWPNLNPILKASGSLHSPANCTFLNFILNLTMVWNRLWPSTLHNQVPVLNASCMLSVHVAVRLRLVCVAVKTRWYLTPYVPSGQAGTLCDACPRNWWQPFSAPLSAASETAMQINIEIMYRAHHCQPSYCVSVQPGLHYSYETAKVWC